MEKETNKIKSMIKLCVALCAILTIGGLLYYFCNIVDASITKDTNWTTWYNFLSPIIAIANVIAFIGLTVSIFMGEEQRQRAQEQAKIQNTVIAKLQKLEQELSLQDAKLRHDVVPIELYEVYIILYRYSAYIKNIPQISIFENCDEVEEKNMQTLVQKMDETQNKFKSVHFKYSSTPRLCIPENERQELSVTLNYLIAYLIGFEMSLIHRMSLDVDALETSK